jgi:hypothetical protein
LDATVENAAVATVVLAAAASFETFASIASELGGIAGAVKFAPVMFAPLTVSLRLGGLNVNPG